MRPNLPIVAAFLALPASVSASEFITVRVCNDTGHDVLVAISYQPVGVTDDRWLNSGWFLVEAVECLRIATTANSYFDLYAEVDRNPAIWWGGNHSLCVDSDGSYDFWTRSQGYSCGPGQELVGFDQHYSGRLGEEYRWTLTD